MKFHAVLALVFLSSFLCFAQEAVQRISIVCDDKENPPYLTGTNIGTNLKPGSLIEFINLMESNLHLKIDILREPIGQVIASALDNGKIEMLFCVPWSYETGRQVLFPLLNGKPDESFALYTTPFVLYKPASSPLAWDPVSKKLTDNDSGKSVGLTYGSEIAKELKDAGVPVKVEYASTLSAFVVMTKGDLSGVIARESTGDKVLAGNTDLAVKITKYPVPVLTIPYFVVFSKQFTERNPALHRKILDYVKANRMLYKNIETWYLKQ